MSNGDEVIEDDEDDEDDDDDEDENEDEDHDDDNKDIVVLRTATARFCHRKWPAASVSGRWAANTLHNSLSVPVLDPGPPCQSPCQPPVHRH